jgi:dTDP-4-dehydrorhamnose 3,5-epimerase
MALPPTKSPALNLVNTPLPGLLIIEPRVFTDARGFFLESYNERVMSDVGIVGPFVQDNHSFSLQNVIRGLHYQVRVPQSKLVRVIVGEIFDVAVDLRRSSPSFGRWYGTMLSGQNNLMMWIPSGFAHGFSVLGEGAHVHYKSTDFYSPESERTIVWNDPDLAIDWRLRGEPILSAKDHQGVALRVAEVFP